MEDTSSPMIRFTDVPPGPYFDSGTLTVKGFAHDEHMVEDLFFLIDNDATSRERLQMDDDGNWSLVVDLSLLEFGDHTITVEAIDPSGNPSDEIFEFEVIEGVEPIVRITSPEERTTYRLGQYISIQGTATDNVGISNLELFIDGRFVKDMTSQVNNDDTFFTYYDTSHTVDGSHFIEVVATDPSGNSFRDFIWFNLDGESPDLELFIYGTPSFGPNSYYSVMGETGDENGIESLWWSLDNEDWIDVSRSLSGGEFDFEIGEDLELEEGEMTIYVRSVDGVGNEKVEEEKLYYDPSGPVVDTSTLDGLYMIEDLLTFQVYPSDPSGISEVIIEVDGLGQVETITEDIPDTIEVEIITDDLVPGDIEIRIITTDGVGNYNQTSISTYFVTLTTDSDRDGMPDWWEFKYGLDLENDDSRFDMDGDGISNLYEYLGDDRTPGNDDYSDPTKKGSVPKTEVSDSLPYQTIFLIIGIILMIGAVVLIVIKVSKRG
jgi:hypothetical protein